MVAPLLLTLLQNSINRYLRLDHNVRRELESLSGRIVRLKITGIGITIYFKIEKGEIHLVDEHNGPIDASLTGSPLALLRTWVKTSKGNSSLSDDIVITGDPHLIQTLNAILQGCDIDWEKQLSQFTGEGFAQKISEFFGGLRACFAQTTECISEQMTECLHEKRDFLPQRESVETFCKDVDFLRDDVERAEARLNEIIKRQVSLHKKRITD